MFLGMVKSTLTVSSSNNFFLDKYHFEGQTCFFLFPDCAILLMTGNMQRMKCLDFLWCINIFLH